MKSFFKTPFDIVSRSLTSWHQGLQHSLAIEIAKQRSLMIGAIVVIGFLTVVVRLGDVMLIKQRDRSAFKQANTFQINRADIVDRNNEVLATNISTASAYANAKQIMNVEEAVEKLSTVIKDLSKDELKKRLTSNKNFVWLARHISPKMQSDINALGIPGVYMYKDQTRIYPHGVLNAHLLGVCGIDGNGLSGVECFFDAQLQQEKTPLKLSIDIRVQHVLKMELLKGVEEFSAKGANAIVMKAKTGEILGMVSLPDFDPHDVSKSAPEAMFNRNTLGCYEPGSVFKILNVAIALESGKATLQSIFDGSAPVQIGKFKVTDFKGLGRPMTLTEAFVKSSNIAAIKISQKFGVQTQKEYMKKFGALEKVSIELPEVGGPLIPKDWREVSMMTISYGYGISQTPLQLITMVTNIINDGKKIRPTLLKLKDDDILSADSVISLKTSKHVRSLMRMVATEGTAKKANVIGYNVFGKTGTAYQKTVKGGYGSDANRSRTTTFIGGFPEEDPEIMLIVMMDDPKATKETAGYATAGWNAAKVAGKIIEGVAPLYIDPTNVQCVNTVEKDDIDDILDVPAAKNIGYTIE
ncbi:MAG: putative peptidoglycan D,D-transpeptidase FtsI [Holosporales bacterium]